MEPLQGAFTVHERLHEQDAAAFERIAPAIRAICGSGASQVARAWASPHRWWCSPRA